MTTVIWDGKEMVADSRARAATIQASGKIKIGKIKDETTVKIFSGENFTFDGEAVECIGIAGCGILEAMQGNVALVKQQAASWDLLQLRMWYDLAQGGLVNEALVITPTRVVTFQCENGRADYQVYMRAPDALVVIGSGKAIARKLVSKGQWFPARTLLAYVKVFDRLTGGTMTAATGAAVETGLPMPSGWKAYLEILKRSYAARQARKANARHLQAA